MTSVLLFLLVTAFAIALLALPFLRREKALDRSSFDLSVYQDQLSELDRDLERGVIDAEASRAAKVEIERRILALAAEEENEQAKVAASSRGMFGLASVAGLVIVVPVASALLYMQLGKPSMRDQPLATRTLPEQPEQSGDQTILANIQQIQERLDAAPDDGDLWILLGRTQLEAGLYGDAAGSFNKAISTGDDDPMLRSELGEAMVYAAEGQVTPRAAEQFETVLSVAPNEPRARYYLGMALAQEGNIDGALEGWSGLLEVSPSDAPWRPQVIAAVRSMLQNVGRPVEDVVAGLPEGTGPIGDHAAASGGGQDDMIRDMVEGLAERLESEPDDVQGWLMLGRSRMVLNEPDLAKAAFERAKALEPENPEVLLGYAASLLEPSETPGGDPVVGDEAAELYEKLVTLAPKDPEPRWLLGVAAAQAGDKDQAIGHWQDLLSLIADGSEDKGIVEARIAALESGEPAAETTAGAPSMAPGAPNGSPTAASGSSTSGVSATADSGTGENVSAQADTTAATNGSAADSGATADAPTAAGTEPSDGSPATGPGPQPTEEDRAAMAALSPEERNGQIRSMVDGLAARLEEDPSDVEGWLRLAQSRLVLNEPDEAKEAYRRAMEVAPENPDVLRAYAASLLGEPHPETDAATVSADAVDLYEQIIDIDPNDPEAHWYLGLAALQDGTVDDARTHWQRVLDVLGPDHPNYAMVQSSLEEVETRTQ